MNFFIPKVPRFDIDCKTKNLFVQYSRGVAGGPSHVVAGTLPLIGDASLISDLNFVHYAPSRPLLVLRFV